ncbi:MAG: hypothetical protein OEZ06_05370 [Myxococcales bacterium]|nr:hypothetical protein [Myxococcales bacterium]
MRTLSYLPVLALLTLLVGCPGRLTAAEAAEAVEESSIATQSAALMGASIEISTDFTIGGAVRDAAAEVRAAIESQLPCAEITLEDATLTIEYGALPGYCSYRGHTFSGSHSIEVSRNEEAAVVVHHNWNELSNGRVSVSGEAEVTWSRVERSRHVVHELTWTRLRDGRVGVGSGDRTQRPLDGGISEGIGVDGSRTWDGESGRWDLAIDGVEMRWADPVPQSGSWTLDTPFDKSLRLDFERIDADTIGVTVTNARRSFEFRVNSVGAVSRR